MIAVREMAAGDVPAVAALFAEMQAHYRVACPPAPTVEASLAGLPDGVAVLVATDPGIVGFACFGAVFPGPGLRPGLFLKELFVSAEARGRGIGTALLSAVARAAVARGCARDDWTADRGDGRLLAFYGAAGATAQPEKVFFRLTGDALDRMAGGARP